MILKFSRKGFSLVELVVALSIVALVAVIAMASLTTIQQNGRDTQRISDLRMLQSALQQYYANENHYPDSLTLTAGAALTNCTGIATGCTVTRTYLSRTPVDPSGAADPYCYTSNRSVTVATACTTSGMEGTCHYYELCARLENPSGAAATCTCDAQNNFEVNPL